MSEPKQTRRRAVQLRPDALDRLNVALTQAWSLDPGSGKLTREEKARILNVSLATSERILKGQGVDRPSLTIAFKSVGLIWDDSFCEVPSCCERESEVTLTPNRRETPLRSREPRLRWLFAVAMLTAIVGYPPLNVRQPAANDVRMAAFGKYIVAAGTAYHAGQFESARSYISEAISIARENNNASYLAESLRITGDLAFGSGDLDIAREHYQNALAIRQSLLQTNTLPALWEALGDVEVKAGKSARASKFLLMSFDGYSRQNDAVGVAMACRGLGSLAHQQGMQLESHVWYQKGLSALEGLDKPDLVADISARNALLLRDKGQFEEARNVLKRCLAYWTSQQHPRWLATTRLQIATVDFQSGNRDQALEMLRSSKAGFASLGDNAGVAECEKWFATADVGKNKPAEHRQAYSTSIKKSIS